MYLKLLHFFWYIKKCRKLCHFEVYDGLIDEKILKLWKQELVGHLALGDLSI